MVKVKVRKKKIGGGRLSLYLDYYPAILDPNGSGKLTRREFLKMYINEKTTTVLDKEYNKQQEGLAEQIRINRENELNKSEVYSEFELERLKVKQQGEKDFLVYFEDCKGQHMDTAALIHLQNFAPKGLKFADLNVKLCNAYKDYLTDPKTSIKKSSAKVYFDRFKRVLRKGYKEGYLQTDLSTKVQTLKSEEAKKEYLTSEELQLLVDTRCDNHTLYYMALFSALTGLRWSDIEKLQWSEIEKTKEGYTVHYRQKKTQSVEVHPISEQAYMIVSRYIDWHGQFQTGKVFKPIARTTARENLKKWIHAAGLNKRITFHSFRHTYATLQLEEGTDLLTVSKMLGHKSLATTQVYAKIVDKTKRAAADRIVLKF
jgi:integrase